MNNGYWAAANINEIAGNIEDQLSDYKQWLQSSGHAGKMQKSYDTYYGTGSPGGLGIESFADGKSRAQINHFKSVLQRLHSLCTQAKIAWQPRARNSDSKSMLQADFAKGLLEFYQEEKNLHDTLSSAVEMALVMFEAFIYCPWDDLKGEPVRPDLEGRVLRKGDQEFHILSAFNVARPTNKSSVPWYILELQANKHDLAALYPHAKEIIMNGDDTKNEQMISGNYLKTSYNSVAVDQETDLIRYLVLLHPRTPAMPDGRYTFVVGGEVLKDGPLPYQKLPVVRLSAGNVQGEVVGDSPATLLIALQEGLDKLFSAVLTNNLNGMVQNIYSADPNITIKKISEGQNLITAAQPPAAVSLVGSASETYKLITEMINNTQILSGVNAVARGQPVAEVKTAGGQALYIAQAIQFIADLQANYSRAASEVGTIIINNLQSFCSEPRLAYIGGASRKAYVREFTSDDVREVDRISVDLGNPVTQTIGGRFDLVQQWMQMGMIKDPSKVVEFLRTGQTDSLTEDQFKDAALIREENEMLKRGELPTVTQLDAHPQHILEHKAVINDPVSRHDVNIVQATLQHIQEHIQAYKSLDPDLAAILGMQPLPSMQTPPQQASGEPSILGQNLPKVPQEAPQDMQDAYSQQMQQISTQQ